MKKKSIIEVFIIIILVVVLAGLVYYIRKQDKMQEADMKNKMVEIPVKQEKDSVEVELDKSVIIEDEEINLDDYTTDITIQNAGTYTLRGRFKHAVIVDTEAGETTLVLDNVSIENKKTAAIIGLSGDSLKINTVDNSTNTLSDGGNSQFDACIYSKIDLIIDGDGMLNVNGNFKEAIATNNANITINMGRLTIKAEDDGINAGGDKAGTIEINHATILIDAKGDGIDSNKNVVINSGIMLISGSSENGDAGIDTDKGYTINGGTVIALGSSMLEKPEGATQNVGIWSLDSTVKANSIVALTDNEDNEVISFVAPKNFQTLIISTAYLKTGTYRLYQGGEHTGTLAYNMYSGGEYTKGESIKVDKRTDFTIAQDGTTTFGKLQK